MLKGEESMSKKYYAEVCWAPEDVIGIAQDNGITITEKEAEQWLAENEQYIADRLVELGVDVIETLLYW
jgi:hypothetical protein